MFRHYLKTAFGMLIKNKLNSIINILGLATGITVCLLILMYLVNELSYERFQKNRKNIYRIALDWGSEGTKMKFAGVMPALAEAINSEIPEVSVAIRIRKDYDAIVKDSRNQEFREENFFFTDPGIFDVFSIRLISGEKSIALKDPYSVIISEKIARKYFVNEDPLGKNLMYHDVPLTVRGVFEEIPENTHLKFEFLVARSTLMAMGEKFDQPWNQWGDDLTYIIMKDKIPANSIIPKLNNLLAKNAGEWLSSRMKFEMQPLTGIHWETDTRGDIGPKGSRLYIYIFMSAAILILIIACFNFLNLSISQNLERIREIGIRKTAGAQKRHLVTQFLTESMILILVSTLIAVYLFDAVYIKLYSYLGTQFVLKDSYFSVLGILVLIIVILIGIIAGGYPALYISKFSPIQVLRKEVTGAGKKVTLRKILVVMQFTISVILAAGTITIFRQLYYMKHVNLGFNKKDVLVMNFPGLDSTIARKYETVRDEMLKCPGIISVSGAYTIPGINSQMNMSVTQTGLAADKAVIIQALPADFGFVKAMGLQIKEGRDLSREYSSDREAALLLNETAVKAMGLTNPVGTRLLVPHGNHTEPMTVVGVVKDFHLQSFRQKINPVLIYVNSRSFIEIIARINPEDYNVTKSQLKTIFENTLPGVIFNIGLLENTYDNLYRLDEKTSQLLIVFAGLALFLSCLGLFGFAAFILKTRVKEIGVRKVLGSGMISVSFLLTRQFASMLLFAGLIACPLSFFVIRLWLKNFYFHVSIDFWIFIQAIVLNLLIAIATVTFLTWKTASENPVKALQYE